MMPKKQSFGICQSPDDVEESTAVSVDRKLIRFVLLCCTVQPGLKLPSLQNMSHTDLLNFSLLFSIDFITKSHSVGNKFESHVPFSTRQLWHCFLHQENIYFDFQKKKPSSRCTTTSTLPGGRHYHIIIRLFLEGVEDDSFK